MPLKSQGVYGLNQVTINSMKNTDFTKQKKNTQEAPNYTHYHQLTKEVHQDLGAPKTYFTLKSKENTFS